MTTQEIEVRMKKLGILHTLKSQGDEFYDRMKTYVYPTIDGRNHDRLSQYYNYLDGCQPKDDTQPSLHVRLLKKIKSASPGKEKFYYYCDICTPTSVCPKLCQLGKKNISGTWDVNTAIGVIRPVKVKQIVWKNGTIDV